MSSIIIISEFPKASELNPILYEKICKRTKHQIIGINDHPGGYRTGYHLETEQIKEVDMLLTWIRDSLPEMSKKFASDKSEEYYGYNINAFEIIECWGVLYNKGESVVSHTHFPYTLSFVYYVNTPEGYSPLTLSGHEIDIKEGQCIFFHPHLYHSVSPTQSNGRCVISGNILYKTTPSDVKTTEGFRINYENTK